MSRHLALGKAQWGPAGPAREPGREGSNSGWGWREVCVQKDVSPALSEEPHTWRGVLGKRIQLRKRLIPAPSSPPPEMPDPQGQASWAGMFLAGTVRDQARVRGSSPDTAGETEAQRESICSATGAPSGLHQTHRPSEGPCQLGWASRSSPPYPGPASAWGSGCHGAGGQGAREGSGCLLPSYQTGQRSPPGPKPTSTRQWCPPAPRHPAEFI